jgi:hypothetical protein
VGGVGVGTVVAGVCGCGVGLVIGGVGVAWGDGGGGGGGIGGRAGRGPRWDVLLQLLGGLAGTVDSAAFGAFFESEGDVIGDLVKSEGQMMIGNRT